MWDIFAADKEGKCPTDENRAPVISAGPDQSISQPAGSVTLYGSITDDGLPLSGIHTLQWRKLSGPAAVVFEDEHSAQTTATFSAPGIYVLQLTGDDSLDHQATRGMRVGVLCKVRTGRPHGVVAREWGRE